VNEGLIHQDPGIFYQQIYQQTQNWGFFGWGIWEILGGGLKKTLLGDCGGRAFWAGWPRAKWRGVFAQLKVGVLPKKISPGGDFHRKPR